MIKLLMIAAIVGNLQQQIYYSVPSYIQITMNTNIYPSGSVSYMQVYGPAGSEISIGDSIYLSKRVMRIRIRNDSGAGTYVVFWHILGEDMLEHQGVRTFTVYQMSLPFLLLNVFFVACLLSVIFLITRRFTYVYHRKQKGS